MVRASGSAKPPVFLHILHISQECVQRKSNILPGLGIYLPVKAPTYLRVSTELNRENTSLKIYLCHKGFIISSY